MPSTINGFISCSQAPWKHSAHQRPRKACGPKSGRSCLSHLLGRQYTKNLAWTRCSLACQGSMTALNFHSMQSGQNVRKSRKNPSYLRQRLSLATSHIPRAWEAFSSMVNEADWGWYRAGQWYVLQEAQRTPVPSASSHPPQPLTSVYPHPHHAFQRRPLCLPPLPLLSRCAFYAADVAAYLVRGTGSENHF